MDGSLNFPHLEVEKNKTLCDVTKGTSMEVAHFLKSRGWKHYWQGRDEIECTNFDYTNLLSWFEWGNSGVLFKDVLT